MTMENTEVYLTAEKSHTPTVIYPSIYPFVCFFKSLRKKIIQKFEKLAILSDDLQCGYPLLPIVPEHPRCL